MEQLGLDDGAWTLPGRKEISTRERWLINHSIQNGSTSSKVLQVL